MLGSDLVKALETATCLPANVEWSDKLTVSLSAWDKDELDITQKDQVIKKISELKPDIVINATGYTDVDGSETNRKIAFEVNADGVGNIAEACGQISASLIHFSTDYVFDGTQASGYDENDVEHLGPINVYGGSKLAGEHLIKSNLKSKCQKWFIIRTSWLYGINGKNFVDTMIKLASEGRSEFKIVDDQYGLPTYTVDLADNVKGMIENMDELESGVYHITNESRKMKNEKMQSKIKNLNEGITWREFAREIFKQATCLGIISKKIKIIPCKTSEFPRPARRPEHSVLVNTKWHALRDWREGLEEYLRSML